MNYLILKVRVSLKGNYAPTSFCLEFKISRKINESLFSIESMLFFNREFFFLDISIYSTSFTNNSCINIQL